MDNHAYHSMRRLFLTSAIILLINSMTAQPKSMTIQFLGMKDGCPNTPKLWSSLNEALNELGWSIRIDSLDLFELSRQKDNRAGYGSPTILINGSDLFGAEPNNSLDPSCRFYPEGVPNRPQIVARLRALNK
jgi:hypothetical protein